MSAMDDVELCEVCGVRPADGHQQLEAEPGRWVATCDDPACEAEAGAQ